MWGNLCTELTNFTNFNVGFSTHKSEILIHLSQWQYWWWFWFSFFWTFYFFTTLRIIKHRVFKMNPRLNTSFRSRGKWGDYLVTLIPLSWCLNILLNSNFILRMIEWQSESGNLILRIHGKQWYWVYKYDLNNVFNFLETPKNLAANKWFSSIKGGNEVHDLYTQTAQIKINAASQKEYWESAMAKEFNINSTFNVNFKKLNYNNSSIKINTHKNIKNLLHFNTIKHYINIEEKKDQNSLFDIKKTFVNYQNFLKHTQEVNILKSLINTYKNLNYYENNTLDDEWEVYSNVRVNESETPTQLKMTTLNQQNLTKKINILKYNFIDSNELVSEKPMENVDFLVVKQKRYKKKQNIQKYSVSSNNVNLEANLTKGSPQNEQSSRFLKNNLIIDQISTTKTQKPFNLYTALKINRNRAESFSINLSRRLLRTTRTLVLPAFTNISIIANSYDVQHSWFIPGLGLKIDCVPGKSTHHSLYIDNVGLYYGQCAEICGRYHHHMPIRVCALPFEHFLVWWTTKGLPKSMKMRYDPKKIESTLLHKYRW